MLLVEISGVLPIEISTIFFSLISAFTGKKYYAFWVNINFSAKIIVLIYLFSEIYFGKISLSIFHQLMHHKFYRPRYRPYNYENWHRHTSTCIDHRKNTYTLAHTTEIDTQPFSRINFLRKIRFFIRTQEF